MLSYFSCVQLFATLWTVAWQAPLSMGFSRQEYWNGLLCPPPGDLPNPGIEPGSPDALALWADSLLLSHRQSPISVVLVPQFLVSFYTIQKVHLLKVFFISLHGSVFWYSFFSVWRTSVISFLSLQICWWWFLSTDWCLKHAFFLIHVWKVIWLYIEFYDDRFFSSYFIDTAPLYFRLPCFKWKTYCHSLFF